MKEMTKGNLSATALENRVRALRVKIVPTAAAFAEWRKAHEAASAALAPAATSAYVYCMVDMKTIERSESWTAWR